MIGEEKLLKFSGVALGEACTLVLRGATQQILDEAERSMHDALCVMAQTVKETRTVYGGGCSEMLMANAVSLLAAKTPGKEAMAIESFARALRMVSVCLCLSAVCLFLRVFSCPPLSPIMLVMTALISSLSCVPCTLTARLHTD